MLASPKQIQKKKLLEMKWVKSKTNSINKLQKEMMRTSGAPFNPRNACLVTVHLLRHAHHYPVMQVDWLICSGCWRVTDRGVECMNQQLNHRCTSFGWTEGSSNTPKPDSFSKKYSQQPSIGHNLQSYIHTSESHYKREKPYEHPRP